MDLLFKSMISNMNNLLVDYDDCKNTIIELIMEFYLDFTNSDKFNNEAEKLLIDSIHDIINSNYLGTKDLILFGFKDLLDKLW